LKAEMLIAMVKRNLYLMLLALLCFNQSGYSQVWQWSVPVKNVISSESHMAPEAFLWIPEDCKEVKGIILAQHNMLEEGILEHEVFRKSMGKLGFAEVWVSPAFDITFNFKDKAAEVFNSIMEDLAHQSGYKELMSTPVIPIGHSALASYPWNFAAWNPERTLAVISLKGDAPQTNLTGSGKPNPDWENRNIDGVPGLMIMGEYEWWEDRLTPGLDYVRKHPNSPITWYTDAGRGHFDFSDQLVEFLVLYIEKAAKLRLPGEPNGRLKPVNVQSGYLMDLWNKDGKYGEQMFSYQGFEGDPSLKSWVFDKEIGKAINAIYKKSKGKTSQYLGFSQKGSILSPQKTHANYHLKFEPKADGITFSINAFFADSSRVKKSYEHAKSKISIDKICGPVQKINDTTFQIAPYRIGLNNTKRSNDIWLLASNEGDKKYKGIVQQANLKFPLTNKEGRKQNIEFYPIKDQQIGTQSVRLQAVSDAALKVDYYVKAGPAMVENGELLLTKIPPSAKFPIKVTVVAWQYGTSTGNKVQSALPVERSFYFTK
jgi:hypothetical protein